MDWRRKASCYESLDACFHYNKLIILLLYTASSVPMPPSRHCEIERCRSDINLNIAIQGRSYK